MKPTLILTKTLFDMGDAIRSHEGRRLHHNLHADYLDALQRLLNTIYLDSYIPPHCHDSYQEPKVLFAICCLFEAMIFDGGLDILSSHKIGSAKYVIDNDDLAGALIQLGVWHTVVAICDVGALEEVKAVQFNPLSPKNIASWALEEGSKQS